MLFSEKFYDDSGSHLLEATGKLFTNGVKVYVQPMRAADFQLHLSSVGLDTGWFDVPGDAHMVSIYNLTFRGPLHRLFQYLLESGAIDELEHES